MWVFYKAGLMLSVTNGRNASGAHFSRATVIHHSRIVTFQMAEIAVSR